LICPSCTFTICGTGNTTAAAEEASLRELLERMDHSSPRAALIYLHDTRERDTRIAKGVGRAFTKGRKGSDTQRARKATGEG